MREEVSYVGEVKGVLSSKGKHFLINEWLQGERSQKENVFFWFGYL